MKVCRLRKIGHPGGVPNQADGFTVVNDRKWSISFTSTRKQLRELSPIYSPIALGRCGVVGLVFGHAISLADAEQLRRYRRRGSSQGNDLGDGDLPRVRRRGDRGATGAGGIRAITRSRNRRRGLTPLRREPQPRQGTQSQANGCCQQALSSRQGVSITP